MKITNKDKQEMKQLYESDPVKFTKYKLAAMYGTSWATVHYTINEEARNKNNEMNKARAKVAREQRKKNV